VFPNICKYRLPQTLHRNIVQPGRVGTVPDPSGNASVFRSPQHPVHICVRWRALQSSVRSSAL
jgi:hypothetical protein